MKERGAESASNKRVDATEKENQYGFWVTPKKLLSVEERSAAACPPGKHFYSLELTAFSHDLIQEAVKLAEEETSKMGFGCSGEGGFKLVDDDRFNLAHAIEHLCVCDLYKRGVVNLPHGSKIDVMAKTVRSSAAMGFWIRAGLASPEEELKSIQNAIDRINNLIK